MNYRSVADLSRETRKLVTKIPTEIDLVVGIPRSGLLAGSLLSLHANTGLTDVDGLIEGRQLSSGPRSEGTDCQSPISNVVIIDDSVNTGSQMSAIKDRLSSHNFSFDVHYCAGFVTPDGKKYVDHWGDVVRRPRMFEWNLFHHGSLSKCSMSLEGVLCEEDTDPSSLTREDLKIRPTKTINTVIGYYPERYRSGIEEWLSECDIQFNKLILRTETDSEDEIAFKTNVFNSTDDILLIDFRAKCSKEIVRQTGKPVFTLQHGVMIRPNQLSNLVVDTEHHLSELTDNPIKFTKDFILFFRRRFSF